jgi:hypothetical protein
MVSNMTLLSQQLLRHASLSCASASSDAEVGEISTSVLSCGSSGNAKSKFYPALVMLCKPLEVTNSYPASDYADGRPHDL